MTRSYTRIFLLIVLMFAGNSLVTAQTPAPDPRIREVFGKYLAQLDATQLSWLDKELDRSEVRKLAPSELQTQYPLLSSLPLQTKYNPYLKKDDFSQPLAINPLKYVINFFDSKDQIFRIDGTDYILLIRGKK